MRGSSSTEDDGAVAGPLTLWAAMAEEKMEEMTGEELCVDKIDRLSAQSATLKFAREVLTLLDPQAGLEQHSNLNLLIFPEMQDP